jgi:hypothetical protein
MKMRKRTGMMTVEEIEKVVAVTNGVDGECFVCAGQVALELARLFPEHAADIERVYQARHGYSFIAFRKEYA